jgi:hypothetical protein
VITKPDLDKLLELDGGPKVSIYMPRHIGSRDTRQDPARLRNLINAAENKLAEFGARPNEAELLLASAGALTGDEGFWREQSRGLAVFISREGMRAFNLPFEPAEHVCAGDAFHLFPLLPVLQGDRRFLLLTVSRNCARLYTATGDVLISAPVQLPAGVQSVAARTDYDGENTPEDYRKAEIVQYLREISRAVEDYARRERLPIVLIALPENHGHFRALGNHPDILYIGVPENPDALDERQLHARALNAIQPLVAQSERKLVERFGSMTGGNRISTEIDEIAQAAQNGRVDTLILSEACETQLDEKLLDTAVTFSLRNGGQAHVLPNFMMPGQAPAAAIFRY